MSFKKIVSYNNFHKGFGFSYFMPHTKRRLLSALIILCVIFGFINPTPKNTYHSVSFSGMSDPNKGWVGTWGTSPQLVEPNNMPPAPGLTNNTLRQVVRVSIGGDMIRLRFSNEFSKSPVTMKAVQIAVSKGGSVIDPSTVKELKFNHKAEVIMNPGGAVTSDPISFHLEPRMDVAITIYFGETSPDVTGHPGSRTTSYLLSGNNISSVDFAGAAPTDHWYVINTIDVNAPKSSAVVALGNSITDGRGSGTNVQDRWPDMLSQSLLKNAKTQNIGVLNKGIGGNCVLKQCLGPSALDRFDRDVLEQSGVRWLIILEGVNDLGGTRDSAAAFQVAKDLISAYEQMITKAHAKGIKVYGATILPFGKSFYYKEYREKARSIVNEWIRTSGRFDAVIDFDKVMRDPNDIISLIPSLQSGDFLHPNEPGYKTMGEAIDLSLFK